MSLRAGVDAVLLDIDDTVVDTHASFAAGMQAVAARWLPHLGAGGPEAALRHWHEDVRQIFPRFTRGEIDFLTQRRLRAQALHDDLGGTVLDDAGFAEWNVTYDDAFRAAWRPLPGAVALVAALAASGVPFGALTNHVTSYQVDKLERTGLSALTVLVGTDTLGVGKPDPVVFRHACELLGSAPERTVYAGNDLAVDAEAAIAAGLQAVWLDRGVDQRGAATPGRRPGTGVQVVRDVAGLACWLGLDLGADLGAGGGHR